MAVFDIRSNLEFAQVFDDDITANGTLLAISVDNSANELGLMFYAYMRTSSAGTHTVSYLQSDTGAFAGEETVVPQQNLIGDNMVFTLATGNLIVLNQGLFGTLKFIKGVVASTGVGGTTRFIMNAIQAPEQKPAQDDVVGN